MAGSHRSDAFQRGGLYSTPLPTRIVSNDEFIPPPQTPAQARVEMLTRALAAEGASRTGMSRRDFLKTSGGVAAAFMQTFGISSGTSNCTNNGQIVKNEQVNVFASINFENLSQEMAQGQGEHLASLATLIGIPAVDQPAFFSLTQERYVALLQGGEQAPMAMLKALQVAMSNNPTLAKFVPER